MKKRRIQVDRVAVTPSLLAHVKHSSAAEVADEPPHGTLRQSHRIGDLVDRTARMDGDVEENRAMTGYQIKVCYEAPLI